MSRKRVWEVGAGVALALVLAAIGAGWFAMRERQRQLDQLLPQALEDSVRNAGDSKRVLLLLQQGASVHVTSRHGWTVLMTAAWHGDMELLREALRRGAKVDARQTEFGTALNVACVHGKTEVVRELLAHGTQVDGKGFFGLTPLGWAKQRADLDIVRLLKQHGATR